MKKRVLSAALSLCLLLTLLPTAALATEDNATTPGTSPATTLQKKITAAENGDTVSLSKDETDSITVSAGKDITLDLAGHKLTNTANNHTVTIDKGASLTVLDSSEAQTGAIDNVSHGKAAVVNHGTFVLNSGSLTRSAEASTISENGNTASGGNSWYVVWNTGNMTVNGGKILFSADNQGYYSSLIDNGWADPDKNTEKAFATLTVTGGELSGGKITIKNDDYGILDIQGGTLTQACESFFSVFNWNDATISGGTIKGLVGAKGNGQTGENAYENGKLTISGDAKLSGGVQAFENSNVSVSGGTLTETYLYMGDDTATISVTGGTLTKAEGMTSGLVMQAEGKNGTCMISGGTFSENPGAEYLKPGLSATEKDGTFSITPAAVETVYPAILADQASEGAIDAKDLCSDYKVEAALKQEADTGDYYNEVAISAKNLKKHTNANSTEGHWIGIALVAPNGAQKMKYAFAASKAELSLGQAGALETNVTDKNESGIAFYVDAGSKTPKTWAQVQWLGENDAVLSNTVYHMDLSGVTLFMAENSAPTVTPAKLHDTANVYADNQLYTAGSYDAKLTSQGAGGVYNVAITAQQLREHTNNGTPKTKGYWVGFELTAPETATKFKYVSGATIPDDAELNPVETLANGTSKGVAFYFNAQNKATRTITVQWTTDDGTDVGESATFSVDLSGVAYYQAPSHGGSGSSGGSASTTYTLTFETNGGSAISKVTKNKGTTIDLAQYAPTKSGATFEGWYADKGLTKKITSVKLDANTTVYAKWTEAPVSGLPFGDVKSADWFYNDVKYVYEKGMMAGTAADVFAPNATTTRAMIVTILYRLEGSPAVTGTSAFVDVPAGQWYTDAVNWAAANQIVKGTSATTFAPNDSITREQMAAILYRYAQYKGYDVTKKADLSGYSDNSQVSAYAKDALAWANAAKLINGVTNTTLAPQGNATRAQVSAILHRFCDGVVK